METFFYIATPSLLACIGVLMLIVWNGYKQKQRERREFDKQQNEERFNVLDNVYEKLTTIAEDIQKEIHSHNIRFENHEGRLGKAEAEIEKLKQRGQ